MTCQPFPVRANNKRETEQNLAQCPFLTLHECFELTLELIDQRIWPNDVKRYPERPSPMTTLLNAISSSHPKSRPTNGIHKPILTCRLSRTFFRAARQSRALSSSRIVFNGTKLQSKTAANLAEVTGPDSSLIGPGAKPGTIPTDVDQATGLERFELLGKMEGVDVFDMENPIFEGKGTMKDPFMVPTYIGYRYVGCRGHGSQEHKPYWMKVEEENPGRCWQCGSVFAAKYVGEPGHNHH